MYQTVLIIRLKIVSRKITVKINFPLNITRDITVLVSLAQHIGHVNVFIFKVYVVLIE